MVATPASTPIAPSSPAAQRRARRRAGATAASAGGRVWTVDSGSPRLRVQRSGMPRSASAPVDLDVGGRRLAIRHLDRVVFPRAGTTKAELLDYYVRIADVMLPHLRDRLLHMHRYPEGVEGPRFWQKECPPHRPGWVTTTAVWSRDKNAPIDFCVLDDVAGIVWAVNLGSIELHTSLHTRADLHRPTVMAFDLDPGDGVDVLACAEVALLLRAVLGGLGLQA